MILESTKIQIKHKSPNIANAVLSAVICFSMICENNYKYY